VFDLFADDAFVRITTSSPPCYRGGGSAVVSG